MRRMALIMAAFGLFLFVQTAQADWTPAKRITWTSGESYRPDVAVDSSGHLHLVWYDKTPGNEEIYYKKSTNGGSSWTANRRLTWNSGVSYWADIAVDSSDYLHLVWADRTPGEFNIFYRKSMDGGATWTASRKLSWNLGGGVGPAVAVDASDNLYVVWYNYIDLNDEIFFKKSTDGGVTWTPSRRLTWNSGGSDVPTIAVDPSGYLHVAWEDSTPLNKEIFYKKSTDGGVTWAANKRLTWNLGNSATATITADLSGNLHVVWYDDTPGDYEIYYIKSADGGAAWTTSERLSWTSDNSYRPAMAIGSSKNLHVVWYDDTPGNREIYYTKSTDGGATWTTSQRLTWNSGVSWYPAICIDASGNPYVFWQNNAPGNPEIYYRKNIL